MLLKELILLFVVSLAEGANSEPKYSKNILTSHLLWADLLWSRSDPRNWVRSHRPGQDTGSREQVRSQEPGQISETRLDQRDQVGSEGPGQIPETRSGHRDQVRLQGTSCLGADRVKPWP